MVGKKLKSVIASGLAALCMAFSPAKAEEPARPCETKEKAVQESVFKADTSLSMGASEYSVNGKPFSGGSMSHASLFLQAKPLEWLAISSETDFSAQLLSALKDGSAHNLYNLSTSLDFSFKAKRGSNRLWLGIMGDYILDKKTRKIQGIGAYTRLDLAGPKASLRWENDAMSLSFSIGALFGTKQTSYDKDYEIIAGHTKLSFVPYSPRLDMPISAELLYWRLSKEVTDSHNFVVRVAAEPGFKITDSFILHGRLVYEAMPVGEDNYTAFETGLGMKLKW